MHEDRSRWPPVELCIDVLQSQGYVVLGRHQVVQIKQQEAAILAAIAQVEANLTNPTALAAAIAAALPPVIVDLSPITAAVAALATQEGVDTTAIEAAIANVQSTLGPVPPAA
jgi:hypothetical protein